MNTILILIITCLAIGMSINTVAQTDDTIYTDGNSRFEVPIPADWDNQSTPELAHFVNIDRTANLYALAVDSDDVAVGIRAGLNVVYNDFIVEPVQVTVIPLPSARFRLML